MSRRVATTCCALLVACSGAEPEALEPGEDLPGGDTTVWDVTRGAFSISARNLPLADKDAFFVGNSFFNRGWVVAPASTTSVDGLGPLYNATSCSACHSHDGRGRPPEPGDPFVSILVRLSLPGAAADEPPRPDLTYGGQLQGNAIPDVPREGDAELSWEDVAGTYDDGEAYTLRRPQLALSFALGEAGEGLESSVRVAPAVFGMGLLEAVPEDDVRGRADPDDADGDGISGRANEVADVATGAMALGRLGWKANQPSVAQQVAGAFLGDIGITSSPFAHQECTTGEPACAGAPDGGAPEIDDDTLADVVFYQRTLAVPARRDAADPEVLRGRALFADAGCGGCHVPRLETGAAEIEALAHQSIWPYTDLLLHDMGEELADGRPDFGAGPGEWRTAPLWGLGLVPTVNRHEMLLHDGRARGFAEAILWHGGEADASRARFRAMSREERAALVRFLGSL